MNENYVNPEIMGIVKFIGGDITIDWGIKFQVVILKIKVLPKLFTMEMIMLRMEQIRMMLIKYEITTFKLEDNSHIITFSKI